MTLRLGYLGAAFLCAAVACDAAGCAEPRRLPDRPVPAKVSRYSRRLLAKYDLNGDGKLQEQEWQKMEGKPAQLDADEDGVITDEELFHWIAGYGGQRKIRVDWPFPGGLLQEPESEKEPKPVSQPESSAAEAPADQPSPAGEAEPGPTPSDDPPRTTKFHHSPKRMPAGLPEWFLRRDADGDGQLTLSEFAPHATAAQQQEFARYDLNSDGVLTPREYPKTTRPAKPAKASPAP